MVPTTNIIKWTKRFLFGFLNPSYLNFYSIELSNTYCSTSTITFKEDWFKHCLYYYRTPFIKQKLTTIYLPFYYKEVPLVYEQYTDY